MGVHWYQRQNQVRRRYYTLAPQMKVKWFLMSLCLKISLCRFNVNRRISIVGFGLYGSIHGPTDYQVNIQVNPVFTQLKLEEWENLTLSLIIFFKALHLHRHPD